MENKNTSNLVTLGFYDSKGRFWQIQQCGVMKNFNSQENTINFEMDRLNMYRARDQDEKQKYKEMSSE